MTEEKGTSDIGSLFKTRIANDAFSIAASNIHQLDTNHLGGAADFGVFGIIVLMNARFRELETLMSKRRRRKQDVAVANALRDIVNLALVAQLIEGGKWPSA